MTELSQTRDWPIRHWLPPRVPFRNTHDRPPLLLRGLPDAADSERPIDPPHRCGETPHHLLGLICHSDVGATEPGTTSGAPSRSTRLADGPSLLILLLGCMRMGAACQRWASVHSLLASKSLAFSCMWFCLLNQIQREWSLNESYMIQKFVVNRANEFY